MGTPSKPLSLQIKCLLAPHLAHHRCCILPLNQHGSVVWRSIRSDVTTCHKEVDHRRVHYLLGHTASAHRGRQGRSDRGQDLLTVDTPAGPKLLYAYLAEQLAGYLGVSAAHLPLGSEPNEVAYRFLAQTNQVEDIYPALKAVSSKAEALPVPEPLLQLADIRPLQLFVTTTFDSFLTRALNQKRFGGSEKTRVFKYSPTEVTDLPGDMKRLNSPIVYYLLGRSSSTPAYAVTQEDFVEFFHSLQSGTRQPPLLFDELNRQSLMVLGSRFSGWLARFFMRMPKRQRLSAGGKCDYVVNAEVSNDGNQVLFLKNFSKGTTIYRSGGVVEFVRELHSRWRERHPEGAG